MSSETIPDPEVVNNLGGWKIVDTSLTFDKARRRSDKPTCGLTACGTVAGCDDDKEEEEKNGEPPELDFSESGRNKVKVKEEPRCAENICRRRPFLVAD